jgi:hypothetical protein
MPHTYLLSDLNGEEIMGSFYLPQLKKTNIIHDYLIEKVLKKRNNELYVKWLGFDDKHNSWINQNQLK